jgi:hypothetical protein
MALLQRGWRKLCWTSVSTAGNAAAVSSADYRYTALLPHQRSWLESEQNEWEYVIEGTVVPGGREVFKGIPHFFFWTFLVLSLCTNSPCFLIHLLLVQRFTSPKKYFLVESVMYRLLHFVIVCYPATSHSFQAHGKVHDLDGRCMIWTLWWVAESFRFQFPKRFLVMSSGMRAGNGVQQSEPRESASPSFGSPTTHLWRHRGERMYSSYSFSNSALDGVSGQRHAPAALYPWERTPGIHCVGG